MPSIACVAVVLLAAHAHPVAAQAVAMQTLAGDWLRLDSNNPPNDRMRIVIGSGVATLTFVPANVTGGFTVGKHLWTGISPAGTLQVLGSDGNYYESTLRLEGADIIHVKVDHSGAGHTQKWGRIGTLIIGDWVRIAIGDKPGDRMRILVDETEATIRFLPASAPRNLRVGSTIWQDVTPARTARVLGPTGQLQPVRINLEDQGRLLRVTGATLAGDEIWARPDQVDSALARLAGTVNPEPPAGAGAPGAPNAEACFATSLFGHAKGLSWGWGLAFTDGETMKAESLGVLEYRGSPRGRAEVVTDIERSRLPGIADNFARIWQRAPSARVSVEHVGLTAAEYDSTSQVLRGSGHRAQDIEVYATSQGMRYAGLWTSNPEGTDWSVVHGLTSEAFGASFDERRAAGYRLIDVEGYATPAGTRFAGIWYRSCDNANWREERNLTRETYQQRVDDLSEQGFRLVDFESYRTANGQLYAGIWERVPGAAWAVRTGRTLQGFLNYHREYTDEGYRLIDYEAYETEDGLRYAGIWAENDARFRMAFKSIVDDSIEAYRETHKIPGISVAIIREGALVYSRGFGWADSARNRSAYSGTVYMMASIAKAVAGTIAARLEARGEIDLTTPTSDHVEGLPSHHTHTLEQLLSKSACVWHYKQGPEPTERYYRWSIDALKQIWNSPLLSKCTPGGAYHYSTHGYTFVAAALEKVTGKDMEQLVQDEISVPGGLMSFRRAQTEANSRSYRSNYHISEPYYFNVATSRSVVGEYGDLSWKVLGGGLQTNAPDLARFGWLTLTGGYVNAAVRDNRLWQPLTTGIRFWSDTTRNAPPVGLGWIAGFIQVPAAGSVLIAEHGGYHATGSGSHLIVYRNQRLVIAILTNQGDSGSLTEEDDDGNLVALAHPSDGLARQLGRIMIANP